MKLHVKFDAAKQNSASGFLGWLTAYRLDSGNVFSERVEWNEKRECTIRFTFSSNEVREIVEHAGTAYGANVIF